LPKQSHDLLQRGKHALPLTRMLLCPPPPPPIQSTALPGSRTKPHSCLVQSRQEVNELDNLTTGKAVDALLNYETVKLFNNERLEVRVAYVPRLPCTWGSFQKGSAQKLLLENRFESRQRQLVIRSYSPLAECYNNSLK